VLYTVWSMVWTALVRRGIGLRDPRPVPRDGAKLQSLGLQYPGIDTAGARRLIASPPTVHTT